MTDFAGGRVPMYSPPWIPVTEHLLEWLRPRRGERNGVRISASGSTSSSVVFERARRARVSGVLKASDRGHVRGLSTFGSSSVDMNTRVVGLLLGGSMPSTLRTGC